MVDIVWMTLPDIFMVSSVLDILEINLSPIITSHVSGGYLNILIGSFLFDCNQLDIGSWFGKWSCSHNHRSFNRSACYFAFQKTHRYSKYFQNNQSLSISSLSLKTVISCGSMMLLIRRCIIKVDSKLTD